MSLDSSGITLLQFVICSKFDSQWRFNLHNIAKKYMHVSLTKKNPILFVITMSPILMSFKIQYELHFYENKNTFPSIFLLLNLIFTLQAITKRRGAPTSDHVGKSDLAHGK